MKVTRRTRPSGGSFSKCEFFIWIVMSLALNVQFACGLIEIQTEKEKHGK